MEKWLYVKLKINKLNNSHVVDRYIETLQPLGVKNDGQGLDYFIPEKDIINTQQAFSLAPHTYIAFAIGAKFKTKALPTHKLIELCKKINQPLILLGGLEDKNVGDAIAKEVPNAINTCGKYNLNQSASIIQQAKAVVTHDTGLMHIAAAFRKNIYTIWGNTTPELGFAPYFTFNEKNKITSFEIKGLSCRPCSKIGYNSCPKGHFKCMELQDINKIATSVNS